MVCRRFKLQNRRKHTLFVSEQRQFAKGIPVARLHPRKSFPDLTWATRSCQNQSTKSSNYMCYVTLLNFRLRLGGKNETYRQNKPSRNPDHQHHHSTPNTDRTSGKNCNTKQPPRRLKSGHFMSLVFCRFFDCTYIQYFLSRGVGRIDVVPLQGKHFDDDKLLQNAILAAQTCCHDLTYASLEHVLPHCAVDGGQIQGGRVKLH